NWCRENLLIEIQYEGLNLTIRLPSGRKLWYHRPRIVLDRGTRPDGTTFEIEAVITEIYRNGQSKILHMHGGHLAENVVMGIEVDIQRHGWAVAEANGFPIVLECYDELVAEVPESKADLKGFYQCLLDKPDWLPDLKIPIAVEGWCGDRYRK